MTILIAIVFCCLFMYMICTLFVSAYKLGMGTFSLKTTLTRMDFFIIFSSSIIIIAVCLWSLLQNQYVYYWDYGAYWTYSYNHMLQLFSMPGVALKNLYYSICYNDYNLILPTLIAFPLRLFGYTFERYVMVNLVFFLLPAMLIMLAFCQKVLHNTSMNMKYSTGNTVAISLIIITFNVFYLAMLKGFIDVAVLIPISLSLLLLVDYDATSLSKNQIVRDLLLSATLLCTFLFRRYFAYYVVGYAVALFCYSLIQINEKGDNLGARIAFRNSVGNILIIGLFALTIMLLFFRPMLAHVLTNSYSSQYVAYDAPLAQKIRRVTSYFGIYPFIIAGIGIFLSFITRKLVKLTMFLALSAFVTTVAFFGVQNLGIHHAYILAVQLCFLMILGVFQIISILKNKITQCVAVITCTSVCVVGFINCFFENTRPVLSDLSGLFSEQHDPFRRYDIDALYDLADYLNFLTAESDKTVYIAASGVTFNCSVMDSLGKPYDNPMVNNLLFTCDVDLRDGFPAQFLSADVVVVTDPVELHLAAGTQEVVRFINQEVINGNSVIGRHFTKCDRSFELDNNVTVYVYVRNSEFEQSDLEFLADYYTSYYPGYEELFAYRILGNTTVHK